MTERIVIKIGGATLFQPNGLKKELCSLLSQYQCAQVWLLVGGGDLVESMRTLHQIYPFLKEEEIHWRCVELLDHTWAIAREIVSLDHDINNRDELELASREGINPSVLLVRVGSFYKRGDIDWIPSGWLPKLDWNTTTDALAWLLGKIIDADRVILMKKCKCSPDWTIAEAAQRGIIDTELARLVHSNPEKRPMVELKGVE